MATVLPRCLAFLADYSIPRSALRDATRRACEQAIDPLTALFAGGEVSETRYTIALSRALRRPVVADWPRLDARVDPRRAALTGRVRLADDPRATWLLAPSVTQIELMLAACSRGLDLPSIALTTPTHFAALLRHRAGARIAHDASHALPTAAPRLSAHAAIDRRVVLSIAAAALAIVAGCVLDLHAPATILGLVFLAGLVFRFSACAEGLPQRVRRAATPLAEAALPTYTILVPLHDEVSSVPGLVAALDQLDYPRCKREVLFLVEAEDHATRAALRAQRLPPGFTIFDVPPGAPRTKPRALNAGLTLARGELVTIYDAEDRPQRDQLRRAAARFAAATDDLACLQARLAISHEAAGLLPCLFAIEYAVLFDVLNPGLARLGLPIGLGGTSNHFRADALRAVGGWDAWNVTEDADLGLRLARFGYEIDMLASTTFEEAPERLGDWFRQRRRWTKGWMQTLVVLARDCPAAARNLGPRRALAVALLLTNLVTGPLTTPFFLAVVLWHLCRDGLPTPRGLASVAEATLAFSVIALGAAGTLWSGWIGARRRGLGAFTGAILFVPYQLMIGIAAWWGLYDLVWRPYHWHKTPHGDAARARPSRWRLPFGLKPPASTAARRA